MTSALKNRLVGTIIIVALAVIFLPDFLDGKKQTNKEPFVSVPASPPKKPIVEPEAFPSERVAKAAQLPVTVTDDKALDDESVTSSAPSETQALPEPEEASITSEDSLASQTVIEAPDSSTVDDAGWVIQLGSFRHEKNVKSLLNKLEKAGYRAFSRRIMTNSGPLNKVFVGPDLEKQKLEAALPHLRELTDLKGKVTTFKVE
ncbi:SPOR domain-containing protein [Alteromonas stellipolaris]|uniref:SPOR domain-containing protein n=1 Tax=Alteromonas stellipolaris TaxID=233316 RepID=UPI001D414A21|nr:SPOR domain-containing protein [Alteromonas stellipolaris]MBZ2163732.1 SPOR domain-containing protein [Alteromonas stellipolaris]